MHLSLTFKRVDPKDSPRETPGTCRKWPFFLWFLKWMCQVGFVWHWSVVYHFQNPGWICKWATLASFLWLIMEVISVCSLSCCCIKPGAVLRKRAKNIYKFFCYYCKWRYFAFSLASGEGKLVRILCPIPLGFIRLLFDPEKKYPGVSRRSTQGTTNDKCMISWILTFHTGSTAVDFVSGWFRFSIRLKESKIK